MIGQTSSNKQPEPVSDASVEDVDKPSEGTALPPEHGGRDGPEPTRFGDWEKNGRCIDF